ncbi:MAG TPA: outer membrane protein assembly factor BamE, partial [Acidiferrobacterales bacterium]|nr:outer membrane protein assembly factor BamE [Acidiferrobacterales bacterium]
IPMRPTLPIVLLLATMAGGCNLLYKPEVQQGTLLSTEMLANLKPGMTKRQVRLLLGSPPISDTFHPERWDYVYSVSRVGEKVTPQHLTLYFRSDTLVRADGDLAPAALVKPANGNAAPGANAPR